MVNVHSESKYSIASPDYRCVECSEEVACEAPYYSAVIFAGDEFQRRNYCVQCWKRRSDQEAADPGAPAPEGTEPAVDSGETEGSEAKVFASWRGRRPAAPTDRPKKVRFDPQLVLEFFLRLGRDPGKTEEEPDASEELDEDASSGRPTGSEGSERDQLRFFLALLLVRKKVLQYRSSVDRGGEEWLRLVDRSTPPQVYEVRNPGLTEEQLERLKDRLGELLQMRI